MIFDKKSWNTESSKFNIIEQASYKSFLFKTFDFLAWAFYASGSGYLGCFFLFFVHHETHSEHVWCLLSFFIVYTIIVLSFFKFFCNTIVKYWFAQISKLKDCKMENISWKILILLRITCWSSFWCLKTMLDTEYTISLYVHCWQDLLCQNHEEKRHRVLRRMSSCSVEGFFLFCWRLVVPKAVPVIEDVHLLYFLCVPGQQSDVSDKIDDRYSTQVK